MAPNQEKAIVLRGCYADYTIKNQKRQRPYSEENLQTEYQLDLLEALQGFLMDIVTGDILLYGKSPQPDQAAPSLVLMKEETCKLKKRIKEALSFDLEGTITRKGIQEWLHHWLSIMIKLKGLLEEKKEPRRFCFAPHVYFDDGSAIEFEAFEADRPERDAARLKKEREDQRAKLVLALRRRLSSASVQVVASLQPEPALVLGRQLRQTMSMSALPTCSEAHRLERQSSCLRVLEDGQVAPG
jgi:hypothetical protein